MLFPPPVNSIGFILLFHDNWLLGLQSLDLLYYFNNGFLVVFYLGLFTSMRKVDFSGMLIALVLGLIYVSFPKKNDRKRLLYVPTFVFLGQVK